jgi:hypothetical protein
MSVRANDKRSQGRSGVGNPAGNFLLSIWCLNPKGEGVGCAKENK